MKTSYLSIRRNQKERELLSHDEAIKLFDYCPSTGLVFRKSIPNNYNHTNKFLLPVGHKSKGGYLSVVVKGRFFRLHRIIWLLMEGYFPEHDIDHVNRIRDDNRWENLRSVSRTCNIINSKMRKDNKSGVCGVRMGPRHRYHATIRVNRKTIHLCSNYDLTEAVCHRYAAEQCLDWHHCDADSSAYQYLKREGIIK